MTHLQNFGIWRRLNCADATCPDLLVLKSSSLFEVSKILRFWFQTLDLYNHIHHCRYQGLLLLRTGELLLPLAKILTYPPSPKFCLFPNKCPSPLTLEPRLTNLWVLPPLSGFVYYDKLVFSRQVEGKNNRKLLTLSIYQPIVTVTEWLNPVKVQTNPKTGIFMN